MSGKAILKNPPSDHEPNAEERYSRQILLPNVGKEGQEKWSSATVFLAGDGLAFQSVATALTTAGIGQLLISGPKDFNPSSLTSQRPDLKVEVLSHPFKQAPPASIYLVATGNPEFRKIISRQLRSQSKPSLFAWCAGSGYALFMTRHSGGACPCLECFEILNPKAFNEGDAPTQRILGALAASEALQWILNGKSPLENKVWMTSLDEGVSFHHEVLPSHKCPARLLDEGATVTP